MTGDVHAYRASDEFAAAIRGRIEDMRRFGREIIKPWDEEHPEARALWRRDAFGLDRKCVGFHCPDGEIPEGLSRNKERRELIPKRGGTGSSWRSALSRLDQFPKMDPVFRRYGVEVMVWPEEGNVIYRPGIEDTPAGVFLSWAAPHPAPGEHLTEVPLSEYYAAIEKRDREKAS